MPPSKLTDRAEEAVDEILAFFRVYHSMRFVHRKLVLRLNRRPSDAALAEMQKWFTAHFVTGGRFEISGPLPEEKEETRASHACRDSCGITTG